MTTQTTCSIDFDNPEILKFARGNEDEYEDPTLISRKSLFLDQGFEETGLKRHGELFDDDGTPKKGVLGIYQAEIKIYDLVEYSTDAIITKVKTQTIYIQEVKIYIWHDLLIDKDISEDKKNLIKNAFIGYQYSPELDPNDFVSQQGIKASDYEAIAYFKIEKKGERIINENQDIDIKKHYLKDEQYRLHYNHSYFEEVKELDDGAVEVDNPEDQEEVIREMNNLIEASPASECIGITQTRKRIVTLFTYPEFKLIWRRIAIKIGCVRVSLKVPQLLYRNSKRVLYAALAHKIDLDRIIFKVVEHCFVKAASSGSIAGLVTANIGIATATFKALFNECIKQQLIEYGKCLLPELIVLKEKDGWRAV